MVLRLNVKVGDDSDAHPSSASAGPEEIRVLVVGIHVDDGAVQEDHLQTNKIVCSDAISVGLEGDASAKEEAADADRGGARPKECPSCLFQCAVYIAGLTPTTDFQDRPCAVAALSGADVGTGSELSLANVIPAVRQLVA